MSDERSFAIRAIAGVCLPLSALLSLLVRSLGASFGAHPLMMPVRIVCELPPAICACLLHIGQLVCKQFIPSKNGEIRAAGLALCLLTRQSSVEAFSRLVFECTAFLAAFPRAILGAVVPSLKRLSAERAGHHADILADLDIRGQELSCAYRFAAQRCLRSECSFISRPILHRVGRFFFGM